MNRRTSPDPRRIVLVTNTGWNMIRFRQGLLERLVQEGWEVTAVADFSASDLEQVRAWGARAVRVEIQGSGTDPLRDARYLLALLRIHRRIRPDVVHHFSVKPVVYGSLAAKLSGVPTIVNSITGLGLAFAPQSRWLGRLVRLLYRVALAGRALTVFQNQDDLERFVRERLVRSDRAVVICGSGVDTTHLTPLPGLDAEKRDTFLMVSRMLWSKGVADFVEAAKRVRDRFPESRFLLFGGSMEDYASKNPDFVPREWLENANRHGVVEWRGWTRPEEVEECMRRGAAVVHPSYYPEGVPRSLIEAASAGTPIITTDTPGCRDAVIDGVSGMLCPPRSPESLAGAMIHLLEDPSRIARMGREGRRLAVERFDARIILQQLLALYTARAPGA